MPVVGIPTERLRSLLGTEVSRDELITHLGHLGCDVEGYTELTRVGCARCETVYEMTESEEIPPLCDACGADLREDYRELPSLEVVRMELLAVRPDMFDPGGLARVLRGYLSVELGAPEYEVGPMAARLTIDPAVRRPESFRPHIACAVIENVQLDTDTLKILMKLQENLHWAIGRDRKHASIGVYDMDTVESELVYTVEDPETFRFAPLGAAGTGDEHAVCLREILEEHPKGVAYAHLLKDHARYPMLKDKNGRVLSMPPIINSEDTKVTISSQKLFVDVTGLGRRVVDRTLNIMVSSLLENLPEAKLRGVEMLGPNDGEERITPDFSMQEMTVLPENAARTLGIEVSQESALELLRRMRHNAEPQGADRVVVQVPAYRNDILHEIDLTEDLAIAYGYHRITPTLVPTFTVGTERREQVLADKMRTALCGLGFQEVMTLVLTSPEIHNDALGRARQENVELSSCCSTSVVSVLKSVACSSTSSFPMLRPSTSFRLR
ncbi:phenylalanine--tRNA ligase subunit beta [Candidatus Eisenbacteria bacterium]|uniref:phenylalanine--tRNA ligase n=1 Tax=Eiseniibacteriota bacterium TaxID=2212470 RepID=A0ABV6YKX5_UNCEI